MCFNSACEVRHRAGHGSPSPPPTTQPQTRTATRRGTSLACWPSPRWADTSSAAKEGREEQPRGTPTPNKAASSPTLHHHITIHNAITTPSTILLTQHTPHCHYISPAASTIKAQQTALKHRIKNSQVCSETRNFDVSDETRKVRYELVSVFSSRLVCNTRHGVTPRPDLIFFCTSECTRRPVCAAAFDTSL